MAMTCQCCRAPGASPYALTVTVRSYSYHRLHGPINEPMVVEAADIALCDECKVTLTCLPRLEACKEAGDD